MNGTNQTGTVLLVAAVLEGVTGATAEAGTVATGVTSSNIIAILQGMFLSIPQNIRGREDYHVSNYEPPTENFVDVDTTNVIEQITIGQITQKIYEYKQNGKLE